MARTDDFWPMRRFVLVLLSALVLASGAGAVSLRELQFLEDRYTHAILHAPPPRDPESGRRWRKDECSPQADLTGPGRLLATSVGKTIQKAGVRIDHVLSGPDCNAVATARLLELVPVDVEDFLASDPGDDAALEDRAGEALFYLAGLRPSETALLVGGGPGIRALTGAETVPGELLIVEVSPLGEISVRFSIKPPGAPA